MRFAQRKDIALYVHKLRLGESKSPHRTGHEPPHPRRRTSLHQQAVASAWDDRHRSPLYRRESEARSRAPAPFRTLASSPRRGAGGPGRVVPGTSKRNRGTLDASAPTASRATTCPGRPETPIAKVRRHEEYRDAEKSGTRHLRVSDRSIDAREKSCRCRVQTLHLSGASRAVVTTAQREHAFVPFFRCGRRRPRRRDRRATRATPRRSRSHGSLNVPAMRHPDPLLSPERNRPRCRHFPRGFLEAPLGRATAPHVVILGLRADPDPESREAVSGLRFAPPK